MLGNRIGMPFQDSRKRYHSYSSVCNSDCRAGDFTGIHLYLFCHDLKEFKTKCKIFYTNISASLHWYSGIEQRTLRARAATRKPTARSRISTLQSQGPGFPQILFIFRTFYEATTIFRRGQINFQRFLFIPVLSEKFQYHFILDNNRFFVQFTKVA
jgi:hypothetical protein